MNLKEANIQLEKLDNEYNYWLEQKEIILSLVTPKSTEIKQEIIHGGKREDRMIKYMELEEEKQINNTLDYIFRKKQSLMTWIENELKIIGVKRKGIKACTCVYRLIPSHYLTVVLEQVCALGLSANIRGLSCTSKYSIRQCRQRRFY